MQGESAKKDSGLMCEWNMTNHSAPCIWPRNPTFHSCRTLHFTTPLNSWC